MNVKILILSIMIIGSLTTISIISSKENSYILLDVSQVAKNQSKYLDSNLRVRGFVELGSIIKKGRTTDFMISLNDRTLKVHFTGENLLPDTFKEGARVRVDGKLKNGVLIAERVEAKCASKYNADYSADKTEI